MAPPTHALAPKSLSRSLSHSDAKKALTKRLNEKAAVAAGRSTFLEPYKCVTHPVVDRALSYYTPGHENTKTDAMNIVTALRRSAHSFISEYNAANPAKQLSTSEADLPDRKSVV